MKALPKKWKALLEEELKQAKTKEEKADIIIEAHDDMVHLQNQFELGADEIHGAHQRRGQKQQ